MYVKGAIASIIILVLGAYFWLFWGTNITKSLFIIRI
jgi:hypothetical protein